MNKNNIATSDETRAWEEVCSFCNPRSRIAQAKAEQLRITRILNRLMVEDQMQKYADLLNEAEKEA